MELYMTKQTYVGIDVGASELVVVIIRNGKPGKAKNFSNTPEGRNALIKYLNPKKRKVKVCLEATGTYHFDIAVELSNTNNIEVMVMNPKAVKNFAMALLQRNKTDAIDAQLLADIASMLDFKEQFIAWQTPSKEVIDLRSAGRRLNELTRQKAAAKNQLHALQATESTPQFVLDSVKQTIANLEQQIKELQQHVIELVDNNDELSQVLELLLSIAGVGKTSAIYIMGEILILPKDMNVKQWVAHAGLDPREFTSGTSVNKQPRLTKAGNRHLRCALFMPALSATRHNVNVKAFYNHLLDKGKKKMQGICAVMRKLLHAIYGILKTGQPFDGNKFYVIPQPI